MFKRAILLVLGALLSCNLHAAAKKQTVYISTVKVSESLEDAIGKTKAMKLKRTKDLLERNVRSKVARANIFTLVERKSLKELTTENELAEVVSDDSTNRVMRFKGADLAVFTEIESFNFHEELRNYQKINQQQLNRKLSITASLRIVDVVTGETKHFISPQSVTISEQGGLIRSSEDKDSEMILLTASKELADKLAGEFFQTASPAKVLAVNTGRVLINRGSNVGFKRGDFVEIVAVTKVTDEDTGEIFMNELPVAKAKLVSVDFKQSHAIIQGNNLGAAKGCYARLTEEDVK